MNPETITCGASSALRQEMFAEQIRRCSQFCSGGRQTRKGEGAEERGRDSQNSLCAEGTVRWAYQWNKMRINRDQSCNNAQLSIWTEAVSRWHETSFCQTTLPACSLIPTSSCVHFLTNLLKASGSPSVLTRTQQLLLFCCRHKVPVGMRRLNTSTSR